MLFVCLGNSCRSQMAEAFARAYGDDIVEAHSAGIVPASRVSRRTYAMMEERGIRIDAVPKPISALNIDEFDLIVNLSEYAVPKTSTLILKRELRDPALGDQDAFRDVREDVEQIVHFLIEHFRVARDWKQWTGANPLYSKECAQAVEARI